MAVGKAFRQSDLGQQGGDGSRRQGLVLDLERLGQNLCQGVARVKAGIGVLEHHRHAAAHPAQGGCGQGGKVGAVKADAPGCRLDQPQDKAGQCGLAAAAFADNADRLAPGDGQRDIAHGQHGAGAGQKAAAGLELPAQVLDLDQGRGHVVTPAWWQATMPWLQGTGAGTSVRHRSLARGQRG